MRRVLMVGGVWLLVLVGVLAVARQQEPLPQWVYFQSDGRLYRVTWDGKHLEQLPFNAGYIHNFSPDGNWIVSWSAVEQQSYITNRVELDSRPLSPYFQGAAWSPNSKYILIDLPNAMSVYDVPRDRWETLNVPTANEYGLSWSLDGKSILYSGELNGQVGLFRVNITSDELQQFENLGRVSGVEWSPDSDWIAYSGSETGTREDIYLMKPDGSMSYQLTDTPDQRELVLAWSSKGDGVFYWSEDNFTYFVRLDGGQPVRLFRSLSLISVRDNWIIYLDTASHWVRHNYQSGEIVQLTGIPQSPGALSVIPPTDLDWHPETLAIGAALTLGAAAITMLRRRRVA